MKDQIIKIKQTPFYFDKKKKIKKKDKNIHEAPEKKTEFTVESEVSTSR